MTSIRILLAASLISASGLAFGQSYNSRLMSVTIPFAFQAAGRALPAGHYTVSELGPQGVINLRETNGRHGTLLVTNDESSSQILPQSKLVFLRSEGQYRLTEVVSSAASARFHVWQKKARYATAGGGGQIETLVLADSK